MKKILVTGIKPTGLLHIGNYFGAIKQVVDLQDNYESKIFVADFHAMTTVNDAKTLSENTIEIAINYLSCGIDTQKTILFKQSDIPEVTELAWIFNCITSMPYLMRAHAFKDAEAKNKDINVGIFDYPILMAADILLHEADIVPVGKDQKQHVEYARDIAEKFNRIYGETFKLPEPLIIDELSIIPGIDGQKMSKSYNNVIPLFASFDEIKKAVMSIKTDSKKPDESKNPDETLLYQIHKNFLNEDEVKILSEKYINGIGYKEAKELLINDLEKFIAPKREMATHYRKNTEEVSNILKEGSEKIRNQVKEKMKEIRLKVGLN